ncbi:MAG: cation:proton antiporter [Flavobacteriaceae bacterium]|nr:cation:proton antiporter [Muriicola sp.]MBT8289598.1 cation:proton antiporter [Muriicola sp.]NNK19926.1 cation:proton antiporter [Flavobacteriaceae bacterium]NNK34791.1 cation:proton antiporter [Eudoraea sp.]NNL39809.1 cation:proton antiporter [Flavobacteriaceae bacterium]
MDLIFLTGFHTSITLICIVGLAVVVSGFLLKKIKQPTLIAYILLGVLIGQYGFDLIGDETNIRYIGELGIILLFFFIGMEIDLYSFVGNWRLALFGTLGQFLLSIGAVWGIGLLFGWETTRILVLGFVIALSSSAVIFKLLEDKNLLDKKIGQNVSSILLAQDIAIAPILILISIFGGEDTSTESILLKIIGGILIISTIIYIYVKKEITWLPFRKSIMKDHELQVFLALFFCFAGAVIAGMFGISEALGAFVGGLIMHAGKATRWIHDAIHSFRILFVAVFFISIGAQINITFLLDNLLPLGLVLVAVFGLNHAINTLILKMYNNSWREAIFGGAMLAQIGELSFLICITALNLEILTDYAYDFTISLISLTIGISPFWILLTEKISARKKEIAA